MLKILEIEKQNKNNSLRGVSSSSNQILLHHFKEDSKNILFDSKQNPIPFNPHDLNNFKNTIKKNQIKNLSILNAISHDVALELLHENDNQNSTYLKANLELIPFENNCNCSETTKNKKSGFINVCVQKNIENKNTKV